VAISFLAHHQLSPSVDFHQEAIDLARGLVDNEHMKAVGYVRVSTEKQADFGVSLEAQSEKVRAMTVVQSAELVEVIIDAGESAKSLNRPGMARLLSLVEAGAVNIVIIAKLDRWKPSIARMHPDSCKSLHSRTQPRSCITV